MRFTEEQISKAKACKSIEELKQLANAEHENLSDEDIQKIFNLLHTAKLSDDDLDAISGGKGDPKPYFQCKATFICPVCGKNVTFTSSFYQDPGMSDKYSPDHCESCGAKIVGFTWPYSVSVMDLEDKFYGPVQIISHQDIY